MSGRIWRDVAQIYKENPEIRGVKMTKSEDTALHVAITLDAPEMDVLSLLDAIDETTQTAAHTLEEETSKRIISKAVVSESEREEEARDDVVTATAVSKRVAVDAINKGLNGMQVLGARNKRGDTPLHCAAPRGSLAICHHIIKTAYRCNRLKGDANTWLNKHVRDAETISRLNSFYLESLDVKRNEEGETPLFLAALNGHKPTFHYLHSVYIRTMDLDPSRSTPMSARPWRKNGGLTILHFTILRQYFGQ